MFKFKCYNIIKPCFTAININLKFIRIQLRKMDKKIITQKYPPLTDKSNALAPQRGVHLYHYPMSACSQLVRVALAHKDIDYVSHYVSLGSFDQYSPQYVKINPRGLVPTLVIDGKVTTDSLNICTFLDSKFPNSKRNLVPSDEELKKRVMKDCREIDDIKIFLITYGNCHYPKPDKRPFLLRQTTKGTTQNMLAHCQKLLEKNRDDPELKEFYQTRLSLSKNLNESIQSDVETVKQAVDEVSKKIDKLENDLSSSESFRGGHGFLYTSEPCLVDLMWSYVLNRFAYLGLRNRLWEDGNHPNVEKYVHNLFAMPAFQKGIREWESPLFVLIPLLLRRKIFGFSVN